MHDGYILASFIVVDIASYYKLPEGEETFNTRWMTYFNETTKDTKYILKSWWQEPSKFRVKPVHIYKIEGLRKVYHSMVVMMKKLYGRGDIDTFLGSWVPMMHTVANKGTLFNWEIIFTSALNMNIQTTKYIENSKSSEFYIASFLLDAFYAKSQFKGWSLIWTPEVPEPIHIYYNLFWNLGYKTSFQTTSKLFILLYIRHSLVMIHLVCQSELRIPSSSWKISSQLGTQLILWFLEHTSLLMLSLC